METFHFSAVDYVVFGGMLLISFAIGLYHSKNSKSKKGDFIMGGGTMGILPIALSLCASFNSAYLILGVPSEIYSYGIQFFLIMVGMSICVVVTAELWVPILYNLKVVSIYEYFKLRYNSTFPRRLMSAIFIVKTVLYCAIVLYAPSIALSLVTPLPWWAPILILGVSSTAYTTCGGLLAIVWTDVFQMVFVVMGLLAILIKGLIETGGIANVWRAADDGGRLEFFNFSGDPFERHTFWNLLFGSIILWGSPYTCSQFLVHRCLCLKTVREGKLSLYINFIGQVILFVIVTLIGLVLYAYYQDCDPVIGGIVKTRDALVPLFVMQQFSDFVGIPGLFISCLFSGALSTLDSALHGMATVTWEELRDFSYFKKTSDDKEINIIRALSVFFGALSMGLAFLCSSLGSLIQMGGIIFGACMGPMFAYILVSLLLPFVNLKGSSMGLILGQAVNIWLSVGSAVENQSYPPLDLNSQNCSDFFDVQQLPLRPNITLESFPHKHEFNDIYRLSYNVYPIIGFVLTGLLSIFCSIATGGLRDMKKTNARFINPFMAKLFNLENAKLYNK